MSQNQPPGPTPTGDTSPIENDRTRPITPNEPLPGRTQPNPAIRPQRPSQEHMAHLVPGRNITQTPPTGQQRIAQATTGTVHPARARRARRTARGGFYLPLWSIGVMLLGVLGIGALIIAAVLAMGGSAAAPASTPVIRIITAAPAQGAAELQLTLPTAEAGSRVIIGGEAPETLNLEGPTLPAVVITPTPVGVTLGATIAVSGVDDQQLNVRDIAGVTGSSILFRADEGEQFLIVDGPRQADGFTWWQIQDVSNNSRTGWAVSNYLTVVSLPS